MKKLNGILNQEIVDREEGDNKIAEHVEKELKRINENLGDIKRYADSSEKKIFDTVKNSVTDVKTLLEEEKAER